MLLGGYAAFECPVRTWWDHVPEQRLDHTPSADLQRRLEAGNDFETAVFATLTATHGAEAIHVTAESTSERVAQTLQAMRAGHLLVLGGQLPHDHDGGRVGKPDILLRVTESGAAPGYVPVDVKHYQHFGDPLKRAPGAGSAIARYSTLQAPGVLIDAPQVSGATTHRLHACLQLAHYTRMLQACGLHPGEDWLLGAIIGTSDLRPHAPTAGQWVLGWYDLAHPLFASYSRTQQGPLKRSALERYDHEFGFRRTVALAALDHPQTPRPVEPIWQSECHECPYAARCGEELQGRAHLDITRGRLGVREWKALADLGITTTAELAEIDLDHSDLVERLVPHVEHTARTTRTELDRAIRRARLVVAGLPWEATTDALLVPTADIEIDVDMENQEDGGLVYMWGVRARDGQDDATARYVDDFHTFDVLDPTQATQLALRYFRWLQAQIRRAETTGRTIAFFHWSHPEVSKLRHHLRDTAVTAEEFDTVAQHHIDLEKFFKDNFFTVNGTGLKVVAPALGFGWPTQDAGGHHSLDVIRRAQAGDRAARAWLLDYNAADTAATAHIRDALRTLDLNAFRPTHPASTGPTSPANTEASPS